MNMENFKCVLIVTILIKKMKIVHMLNAFNVERSFALNVDVLEILPWFMEIIIINNFANFFPNQS